MKNTDLQDIVIMQDTTQLAFNALKDSMDTVEYHWSIWLPYFNWDDPEITTLSISINVCIVLRKLSKTNIKYLQFVN